MKLKSTHEKLEEVIKGIRRELFLLRKSDQRIRKMFRKYDEDKKKKALAA